MTNGSGLRYTHSTLRWSYCWSPQLGAVAVGCQRTSTEPTQLLSSHTVDTDSKTSKQRQQHFKHTIASAQHTPRQHWLRTHSHNEWHASQHKVFKETALDARTHCPLANTDYITGTALAVKTFLNSKVNGKTTRSDHWFIKSRHNRITALILNGFAYTSQTRRPTLAYTS